MIHTIESTHVLHSEISFIPTADHLARLLAESSTAVEQLFADFELLQQPAIYDQTFIILSNAGVVGMYIPHAELFLSLQKISSHYLNDAHKSRHLQVAVLRFIEIAVTFSRVAKQNALTRKLYVDISLLLINAEALISNMELEQNVSLIASDFDATDLLLSRVNAILDFYIQS